MKTLEKLYVCLSEFSLMKGRKMRMQTGFILLALATLCLHASTGVCAEPIRQAKQPIRQVKQPIRQPILNSQPSAESIPIGGTETIQIPVDYQHEFGGDQTYRLPHTNGDLEFAGHGPHVSLHGELLLRDKKVVMKIDMLARETRSNWSEARGSFEMPVFSIVHGSDPRDWNILRIEGVTTWAFEYTFTNHEPYLYKTPWGVIVVYGDHAGDDILVYTGFKTMFTYNVPIVLQRVK